jgi:hypothetical protein
VGLASELCTSYTPRNAELATLKQHQDPASPNSRLNNKAVVLELARQIAAIGGESLLIRILLFCNCPRSLHDTYMFGLDSKVTLWMHCTLGHLRQGT